MFYGLKNTVPSGAGYHADIVFLDNLEEVRPTDVMKDGRILGRKTIRKIIGFQCRRTASHGSCRGAFERADSACMQRKDRCDTGECASDRDDAHLVEEVPTEKRIFVPNEVYNKICVVERHGKTGEIGVAPLRSFGVKAVP